MSQPEQEKQGPEIDQARAKLDDVLQRLTEEAAERDAPPKKGRNSRRKRHRENDSTEPRSNTYIKKIFECSIDLAQFDEDSSLYSMCRSWIKHKPLQRHGQNHGGEDIDMEKNTTDSDDNEDPKGIYFLPAPVQPPKDDAGKVKNVRIPSPIPKPHEKFFVASDDSEVVPVNALLAGHQARWKNVQRKWKEAAMANEERYKESSEIILKAMSNDKDAPMQCQDA